MKRSDFLNKYIIAFLFLVSLVGFGKVYIVLFENISGLTGVFFMVLFVLFMDLRQYWALSYDLIKAGYLPSIKWWMIFMLGFIVSML